MKFIAATENDLLTIQRLAKEIWNEHYITIISQEQIDCMPANRYSEAVLAEQMKNGQQFFLYINENNDAAGFLGIEQYPDKSFYLHKFYLNSTTRGKGVGAAFFDYIIKKLNVEKLKLQVNRQNYKSINFYFKVGFVIERVENFDIGGGYWMEDFVMQWQKPN